MKIKINKDILIWAREELNLYQEIVANKVGRKLEDVQAWEMEMTTLHMHNSKNFHIRYKKNVSNILFSRTSLGIFPKLS